MPELMAEIKVMFINGCKKLEIIDDKSAETLFGWIEKSQRYLFCMSHSVSYAVLGYMTAYLKVKYTKKFFRSWLNYCKEEQNRFEEIKNLCNDAKLYIDDVLPPNITKKNKGFEIDGNTIIFGLSDIRGIGEKATEKIFSAIEESEKELAKDIGEFSWFELLISFTEKLSSTAVEALICSGAFSFTGIDRQKMRYEYEKWTLLTDKEREWVKSHLSLFSPNISSALTCLAPTKSAPKKPKKGEIAQPKLIGGTSNKNRSEFVYSLISSLENPPYKLEDSYDYLYWNEEHYLGIALSCSKVDGCDVANANCDCRDLSLGREGYCVVAIVVDRANEITTKKNQKMAFVTGSDSTGQYDGFVVFPKIWQETSSKFFVGNTVLLRGNVEKGKSFIVEKIWPI